MFYTNAIKLPLSRLVAMKNLLEKISIQAKEKNISEETILTAKLAPDMFPFFVQIKIGTSEAIKMAETFTGKNSEISVAEMPNLAELKKYLDEAINFLKNLTEKDIVDNPETAYTEYFWAPGMKAEWINYLLTWALPNFHFHMVTAYNILRNLGFEIGKMDYIWEGFEMKAL